VARPACAARRSRCSPASACPGTRGSSRAATSRPRRARPTRAPRCAATATRPPGCSGEPARVLAPGAAEPAPLFALAGVPTPASADPYPAEAPAELREMVLGLAPCPAYLLGPRCDVLVWDAPAATPLRGA